METLRNNLDQIRIGPLYEKINIIELYEEFKDRAILEPNLRFYKSIDPSYVDIDSEYDIYIHTRDDSIQLVECKARVLLEKHINKFHILPETLPLLISKYIIITSEQYDENLEKLAIDKNIELRHIDPIKKYNLPRNIDENDDNGVKTAMLNDVNNSVKTAMLNDVNNSKLKNFFEYQEAAYKDYPGYYLFLNTSWIKPFSMKIDIIYAVKEAMKNSIQGTEGRQRKLMEFLYLKAYILEKWFSNVNNRPYITQDLVKILNNDAYQDIDKQNNLQILKNNITNSLGFEPSIFSNRDNSLVEEIILRGNSFGPFFYEDPRPKEQPSSISLFDSSLTNIKTLYILIGMDHQIINNLKTIIYKIWDLNRNNRAFSIQLIHTDIPASQDVARDLNAIILGWNPPPNIKVTSYKTEKRKEASYKTKKRKKASVPQFLTYINKKCNTQSSILITYIPKDWVLNLHENRRLWKNFLMIERPEDGSLNNRLYNIP